MGQMQPTLRERSEHGAPAAPAIVRIGLLRGYEMFRGCQRRASRRKKGPSRGGVPPASPNEIQARVADFEATDPLHDTEHDERKSGWSNRSRPT